MALKSLSRHMLGLALKDHALGADVADAIDAAVTELAGALSVVTVTASGNITSSAGNFVATTGDVTVTAGDITVTAGAVTVTAGTLSAGTVFSANDTTSKLAFYGATAATQPTALTTALTTLTNAGTASDYAIQALTNSSPFGFVSQAEGETVVDVVLNNQARINELETKLQALGLIA